MLVIAMFLSAVLVVVANQAMHHSRYPIRIIFVSSLALAFGPAFFLMSIYPAVALLGILLTLAAIACRCTRRTPRFFTWLSGLACMVVCGIVGWSVLEREAKYTRLRERFPYESMEDRLPHSGLSNRAQPQRLAGNPWRSLEDKIADVRSIRMVQLQQLHEHAVNLFINSPGFGVTRMMYPSEPMMTVDLRPDDPLPQPGSRGLLIRSPGEWQPDLSVVPPGDLSQLHEESFLDFVHPRGFGYCGYRIHVARCQTPEMRRAPGPAARWTVQTIDLISLLLHDEPVAYITDHLPRMDELRSAPTRPLDELENKGMEALRSGEDLVMEKTATAVRMVGVLRSVRQCLSCHGGERGDLLGAFSYTLARDP